MAAPSWVLLFGFAALTRGAVLLFGFLAAQHLPPLPMIETTQPMETQTLVRTFHRWDATYYLQISESGYNYTPGQYCTAAFMPLLPMTISAAKRFGVEPYLAGIVIPNLAFCIGMMFFGRAVLLATKNAATAWKACALLAAFPTAFFFSCPYQESLAFLSLSVAWWGWLQQRVGLAASGVFFGCLARLTSLAFPAALALDWLHNAMRRKLKSSLGSILIVGLAGVLAVALFCLYLHHNVGDALAHMKAHAAWNRKPPALENIVLSLQYLFYFDPLAGRWQATYLRVGSLFLFVGLGLRALKVRGVFPAAMILLPILQAVLTGTPMSLERIVLASFFGFVDLAELLKAPWKFWTAIVVGVALQAWLLNGYVHFQFVG